MNSGEENKTIVYVPKRSRIRAYKIAKAIKYCSNYKLIVVCEKSWYDEDIHDGIFDEVITYNNHSFYSRPLIKKIFRKFNINPGLRRMLKLVKSCEPDMVHAFCEPYDHIKVLIDGLDCPIIMSDGADFTGISEGIENLSKRVRKLEQYCFENVDGIVHKGPKEVISYYQHFDYKICEETITWFDNCDAELFMEVEIKKRNSEKWHLVYTGVVSSSPKDYYCYYIPLAKYLDKQNIHFHIYPNPYQYDEAKAYRELSDKLEHFHFHKPMNLKALVKEISKYDVGLWLHSERPSKRTQKDKMKTGMVNKIFTYMEAGLPIFVSDSREFGARFVTSNEIGLVINDFQWFDLKNIVDSMNYSKMAEMVKSQRKVFSIQNMGTELLEYYNKKIK